jgi:hypothetical protein
LNALAHWLFQRCYQNATTRREQHACYLLASFLKLLRNCIGILIERECGAVMARESLSKLKAYRAMKRQAQADRLREAKRQP